MILVSCRRDFSSDRWFGDGLAIRDYPSLSNLNAFAELSTDDLLDRVDGRHALVLVHGYRNPLRNMAAAYKQLAHALTLRGLLAEDAAGSTSQYGVAIGFAWPGFKTRVLGFFAARPNANRAGGYLRTLIDTLRRSARTVDVQTHSLGARVALQALSTDTALWVDNLMLTAPAVDDECLRPRQEFHEALDSCNRVLVYHSRHDPVLKTYIVASVDRALGSRGPDDRQATLDQCPNVFVVDCQRRVREHGDYRKTPAYLDHWAKVMGQVQLPRYDALP